MARNPSNRGDAPIFREADPARSGWLAAFRTFLGASAGLHLAWEILQLPLYTIWQTGTARELVFAVAHCTLGDVLIALSTLSLALVLAGHNEWPRRGMLPVAAIAIVLGIAYTAYSEHLNVAMPSECPCYAASDGDSEFRPSCNGWRCPPWSSGSSPDVNRNNRHPFSDARDAPGRF